MRDSPSSIGWTFRGEKFPFLDQIPFSLKEKIQLEVAYNMTKLDFILFLIDGFDMFI